METATAVVTKSDGQERLDALLPTLKENQTFEKKSFPVRSNWASKIGHPCERYLYHNRHDWENAQKKDWKGIGILGNLLADWWMREMSAKGFNVVHQEIALKDDLAKKYEIGGRIDCRIGWRDIKPLICEIKTMDERYWVDIETYDDMVSSSAEWIRGYPAQLQIYLLSESDEIGIFALINKKTLETKLIPVYLDYGYCEWLLQRVERVNIANKTGEPPKRIPYCQTCKRCDYSMICLPDIKNEGLDLIDNQHLEEILKEMETLEAGCDRYLTLEKESKAIAKDVGKNFIVGTSYMVEFRNSIQKRLDLKSLPPEIKLQYEKEFPIQKITFVPLGDNPTVSEICTGDKK